LTDKKRCYGYFPTLKTSKILNEFRASLSYVNKRKGRGREVKKVYFCLATRGDCRKRKIYSLLDDENKTFENLFISISAL